MNVVHNPPPSAWKALLERPTQKFKQTKKIVSPILKKVKKKGDTALRQFSLEYDHVELNELAVSEAEIQSAREADQFGAAGGHSGSQREHREVSPRPAHRTPVGRNHAGRALRAAQCAH